MFILPDRQKSKYGFDKYELAFFACHLIQWFKDHPNQKKLTFSKSWLLRELGFESRASLITLYKYNEEDRASPNFKKAHPWMPLFFEYRKRWRDPHDKELIELSRSSKVLMMLRYFPQDLPYKWFHLVAMKALAELKHTLLLMPMGFAKSTLSCVIDVICEGVLASDSRQKIIGSNQDFGKKWTWTVSQICEEADEAVKRGFVDSPFYLLGKDFGPFKPKQREWRWSVTQLDFARRSKPLPDASVEAYGFDALRAGGRAEKMRLDDVVDPEKHESDKERRDQINRNEQIVMTRADNPDDFFVKATGTIYFVGDIMHWYYTRAIDGKDDRFSVWWIDIYGDVWHNGVKIVEGDPAYYKSIWPEKFPSELLEKEKAANMRVFEQTRRNIVYPEGDAVFPLSKLDEARNREAEIGFFDPDARVYIAADPSFGRLTKKSGEAAILVLADGGEQVPELIRFVDWWHAKSKTVDFAKKLYEIYDKYRSSCVWVGIEGNVADLGFKDALKEIEGILGKIPRLRYPETKRNKLSYEIGVNTISREFEDGDWSINAGGKEGLRMSNELIEQFAFYSPGFKAKDDLVICAWLGISEMRRQKRIASSRPVYHEAPPFMGGYIGQDEEERKRDVLRPSLN